MAARAAVSAHAAVGPTGRVHGHGPGASLPHLARNPPGAAGSVDLSAQARDAMSITKR